MLLSVCTHCTSSCGGNCASKLVSNATVESPKKSFTVVVSWLAIFVWLCGFWLKVVFVDALRGGVEDVETKLLSKIDPNPELAELSKLAKPPSAELNEDLPIAPESVKNISPANER